MISESQKSPPSPQLDDEKHNLPEEFAGKSPQSPRATNPPPYSENTLRKLPWRLQVTDFSAILSAKYKGSGTEEMPFIVTWLDNDPENPQKYSMAFKCWITALIAILTLCVSLASSAYTGAAKEIVGEFHVSDEVFLLGLSLMVLGFAVGPLAWAPLSEATGRRNVLLITMFFYTIWTAVCAAAQNIQSLIVFRFLAGTTGSAAFVIPGGFIADVFGPEHRGVAISVYAACPFLGPTMGPMIGGFLSPSAGWRWLMGFLALYSGTFTILGILLIPETYPPVLLRARAKRLSAITGKCYMTQMDIHNRSTFTAMMKKSLVLPLKLLFREPIVLCLAIYQAVVYGTLYLCFAAFPIVFGEKRGWNAGETGLAFMGILVGIVIGVVVIFIDNQKRYIPLHHKHKGFAPPESRLPPVILGGGFAVIGLAWFAATVGKIIPWPAPVIAGLPFGVGFILIFMQSTNYLVDSYVVYAASVNAAMSVLRSVFGAVFPLFTTYMYRGLGVNWGQYCPSLCELDLTFYPKHLRLYLDWTEQKGLVSPVPTSFSSFVLSDSSQLVPSQASSR